MAQAFPWNLQGAQPARGREPLCSLCSAPLADTELLHLSTAAQPSAAAEPDTSAAATADSAAANGAQADGCMLSGDASDSSVSLACCRLELPNVFGIMQNLQDYCTAEFQCFCKSHLKDA